VRGVRPVQAGHGQLPQYAVRVRRDGMLAAVVQASGPEPPSLQHLMDVTEFLARCRTTDMELILAWLYGYSPAVAERALADVISNFPPSTSVDWAGRGFAHDVK